MGIRVSNIAKDERTFDYEFGGESATITYRPGVVTTERMDALREVPEDQGDHVICQFLSEILVKWDVEKDDGSMWPTDYDGLRGLPLQFVGDVLMAIRGDVAPDPAEGKA